MFSILSAHALVMTQALSLSHRDGIVRGALYWFRIALCFLARNGWAAAGLGCKQVRNTEETPHAHVCLVLRAGLQPEWGEL
jgi:hypothetical protein